MPTRSLGDGEKAMEQESGAGHEWGAHGWADRWRKEMDGALRDAWMRGCVDEALRLWGTLADEWVTIIGKGQLRICRSSTAFLLPFRVLAQRG